MRKRSSIAFLIASRPLPISREIGVVIAATCYLWVERMPRGARNAGSHVTLRARILYQISAG